MPCAFADPVVVTSPLVTDTETTEGVAGSVDGTSASIVVGTEGGGETPNIGEKSGGAFVKWHPAYGAWRALSLVDGTIALADSKATILSGKLSYVYGAYGWL